MSQRRFLALVLPRLATDRLRRCEPALRGQPLATWTTQGQQRRLVAVDAPGTTLRPGQALADAQAMHPALVLRPDDPAADRAALERLALWALRFTPLAAVDPPDGLILDVTGCTDFCGGEAALLDQIHASLARGGFTARAVLAGVAAVATALARAGRHGTILPPGKERVAMATLPLGVLRLDPDCLTGLHRLGLQRVGEVLRQPRGPLVRRFGRELADALDGLAGTRSRPLQPVRPTPGLAVARDFVEPVLTRPGIERALDQLLDRLCRALEAAGQGARQVTLRAVRVDHHVQDLIIGTVRPTRQPAHLRRLFAGKLERLEPGAGFERFTLRADVTNPLDAVQQGIPVSGKDPGRSEAALANLFDRLSQRVAVWRLMPVASHWPERAVRRVGASDPVSPLLPEPRRARPVCLLSRPLPLQVVLSKPDGPPAGLCLDGVMHPVAWAEGPERLEPEWWRESAARPVRDYYRVSLVSGARLWIGCVPVRPGHWFLHGHFP
ncbi:Protein ImuB [Rhodovastum atsumiense]|uniref:DNA polymerase Y family protein n=1 Tax=Rhodovastum atsumiense TaxID=504468 RepID=A0A5M6IUK4_9PROT|nr:DNA polymerase Y family protein [Rhodovastum atsumiense]KAA5611966.1 DNA polymerase Y family protein [Rhodovastum atsumiense]CAH2598745.1 Protein ImuB [Rhodovastum atsumiense]